MHSLGKYTFKCRYGSGNTCESHRPDEVCLCEPPAAHGLVLRGEPRADDGGVVAVEGEVGAVARKVQDGVVVHPPHRHRVRQDGRLQKYEKLQDYILKFPTMSD